MKAGAHLRVGRRSFGLGASRGRGRPLAGLEAFRVVVRGARVTAGSGRRGALWSRVAVTRTPRLPGAGRSTAVQAVRRAVRAGLVAILVRLAGQILDFSGALLGMTRTGKRQTKHGFSVQSERRAAFSSFFLALSVTSQETILRLILTEGEREEERKGDQERGGMRNSSASKSTHTERTESPPHSRTCARRR